MEVIVTIEEGEYQKAVSELVSSEVEGSFYHSAQLHLSFLE